MLLAIDIGNSATKLGVFHGENLIFRFAVPTVREQTAVEIHLALESKLKHEISAVIVSSVVPEIDAAIAEFSIKYLKVNAVFVNQGFDFGFSGIKYEPLSSVGTDRLVAAFAAVHKYGEPCIVCDFGTATTIDAVNFKSEYLGGVIAPGMQMLAEALHLKTSKLPQVPIEKPLSIIGNTTGGSIQSGIFYGSIGAVEGILTRMRNELGETPKIIATGGFAKLIAAECALIDTVDENLTLDGLRLLRESHRL